MRQYRDGAAFCRAVIDRVGMDGLQPGLDLAGDAADPRRDRRSAALAGSDPSRTRRLAADRGGAPRARPGEPGRRPGGRRRATDADRQLLVACSGGADSLALAFGAQRVGARRVGRSARWWSTTACSRTPPRWPRAPATADQSGTRSGARARRAGRPDRPQRARGGGPSRPLRRPRCRGGRGPRHRAARPHPGRPGGDRAARTGPGLGPRSLAGMAHRSGRLLRPLLGLRRASPSRPARARPRAVDGSAERRPAVRPRPGPEHGAARSGGRAGPGDRRGPGPDRRPGPRRRRPARPVGRRRRTPAPTPSIARRCSSSPPPCVPG